MSNNTNTLSLSDILTQVNESETAAEVGTQDQEIRDELVILAEESQNAAESADEPKKKQKVERKPRKVAEPKPPVRPPFNVEDLHSFISAHESTIKNSQLTTLKFSNVPENKYIMFLTNDEADADIFLVSDANRLVVAPFTPESIVAVSSGVIITSSTNRCYTGRLNTTQYEIDENGMPKKRIVLSRTKKNESVDYIITDPTGDPMPLDAVKLRVMTDAKKIYESIKEMTERNDIMKAVHAFMATVVDINYLIKLEDLLLDIRG